MPKYLSVGSKYYSAGQGGQLQEVSPEDIVARTGGVPIEQQTARGEIAKYDPSAYYLEANPSLVDRSGSQGYYLKSGPTNQEILNLGGSAIVLRNLAEAQALGINPQTSLPQGQITQDTSFQDYLVSQQQTLGNIAPGQFDATVGPKPFQTGGQFGNRTFGRVGNQVFETTGGQRRPITEKEFNDQWKAQGLNLEVLPQLGPAPTSGQAEAEKKFGEGAVGTAQYPSEQRDFFKTIQDRMDKLSELETKILSVEKTDIEKRLETQEDLTRTSAELGLVDIEGQTIPMQLIVGQQAQLERQANARLAGIQRQLSRLKDDRESKARLLEKTYDIRRQSMKDAISLYEMTQPDKIGFDAKTGTVFYHNPMNNEVYFQKIKGFIPQEDKIPFQEEYEYMQRNGYTGTPLQYAQWKATQFGTEDKDGGGFSDTQINKGAVNAGVTIDTFKKLDTDTKNYYINAGSDVEKAKKEIKKELDAGTDLQEIIKEISAQNVPRRVINELTLYAQQNSKIEEVNWYNPLTWF